MDNGTQKIILICHNIRSCNNVGSLLRTADGIGIQTVYLTGYSPYPLQKNDKRLPHLARKIHARIQKTALGAEKTARWVHEPEIFTVIAGLREEGYMVAALEQTDKSVDITGWRAPAKTAVLVGRETEGVEPEVLAACDTVLEIPMLGQKESYNVVQATAMALYHCRFMLQ